MNENFTISLKSTSYVDCVFIIFIGSTHLVYHVWRCCSRYLHNWYFNAIWKKHTYEVLGLCTKSSASVRYFDFHFDEQLYMKSCQWSYQLVWLFCVTDLNDSGHFNSQLDCYSVVYVCLPKTTLDNNSQYFFKKCWSSTWSWAKAIIGFQWTGELDTFLC